MSPLQFPDRVLFWIRMQEIGHGDYQQTKNCFDPLILSINYLDPVALRQARPGDAKHKIKLMSPKQITFSARISELVLVGAG